MDSARDDDERATPGLHASKSNLASPASCATSPRGVGGARDARLDDQDERVGSARVRGADQRRRDPARGGWDQPSRSPHGAQPNDRWGGPSPYQGGVAPGPELPAMAIADAIFDEIRASGTETRAPELTDRHLEVLAAVFRENHLANALELVQTGRVKRLVAERSGRSCFQVQGKSAREEYLVHPRHYCSCRAFQWDVVSRGDQLICKHQLAARIAQATGAYPSRPSPISSWRNS